MRSPIVQLRGGNSVEITPEGFYARSAQIDNLGGQWLYFPALMQYVQPYMMGVVIPLPNVIRFVVQTIPPSGYTNTASGNAASILLTDEQLIPSPGIFVPPTTFTVTVLNPTPPTPPAGSFLLGAQNALMAFNTSIGVNTMTPLVSLNLTPGSYLLCAELDFSLVTSGTVTARIIDNQSVPIIYVTEENFISTGGQGSIHLSCLVAITSPLTLSLEAATTGGTATARVNPVFNGSASPTATQIIAVQYA
jgi:hypothetical protein